MAFYDIEQFDETHSGTRRVIFISCLVFVVLVAAFFIIFASPYSQRNQGPDQRVDLNLHLKLSANDLVDFLGDSKSRERINITVMESKEKVYRAKLSHRTDSNIDFQMEINNVLYTLYRMDYKRREIYNYFKLAGLWGIETAGTRIVGITINGILIGQYIMEQEFYPLVRDGNKNYLVSLGANTYRLRKILHFVKHGDASLLNKYFNLDQLASYMVYFNLFSITEPLDFGHMLFRFNTPKRRYIPFLTVKSVLTTLEEDGREFKNHDEYNFLSYRGLDHKNIRNLRDKANSHEYKELIETILVHAIRSLQGSR